MQHTAHQLDLRFRIGTVDFTTAPRHTSLLFLQPVAVTALIVQKSICFPSWMAAVARPSIDSHARYGPTGTSKHG